MMRTSRKAEPAKTETSAHTGKNCDSHESTNADEQKSPRFDLILPIHDPKGFQCQSTDLPHQAAIARMLPPGFCVETIGRRAIHLSAINTPELKRLLVTIRNDRSSIDYIEVTEKRAGYGTKWILWLEDFALQLGVTKIIGQAQHGTEGFWRKLGYTLTSRGKGRRQSITKFLLR